MKIEESRRRQEQLKEYILEMSLKLFSEEETNAMAFKMKDVYSDHFRHYYSSFYPTVLVIFDETNEYSVEYLSNNLEQLRNIVERDYFEKDDKNLCKFVGLYQPLTKLTDHINLEIARNNTSISHQSKLKDLEIKNRNLQDQLALAGQQLADAKREWSDIKTQMEVSQSEWENIKKQMEASQKEYVAILGIFAAAVLTFTGAITFSSSILDNIAQASIYRTLGICIVLGMVLADSLYLLFSYIDCIVHEPKEIGCKALLAINAVFIFLLCVVWWTWKDGAVEKRDYTVASQIASQYEVMEDNGGIDKTVENSMFIEANETAEINKVAEPKP